MENTAYNDYQIFSPKVMEQLARAYFERNQNKNLELKELISSLNILYSQLEQMTFQKQKIITIKNIINNNIKYFSKNNEKIIKKSQLLQNYSPNYLIKKIIATELKVLKISKNFPDVFEAHVENIEQILMTF